MAGPFYEPGRTDHDTSDSIPVTIQIFRCAVQHHISSKHQRLLEIRCHESIVHHHNSPVLMRYVGYRFYICQFQGWVCRCLKKDKSGILPKSCFDITRVRSIYETHFYPQVLKIYKKVVCAAVDHLVSDYVVASFYHCENCGTYCRHSRCLCQCCLSTFKACNPVLEHLCSGIETA